MKNKSLSIIVPIYNVEKYVRPCLESIFKQGLDDETYELILVNDGTPDRSMEVIADIISQHQNVTVITQENQGLSVARNNGIAAAKGEYILMPDSDDLLIENSLPILLETALTTKADMIDADYVVMNDDAISGRPDITQKAFEMKEKSGTAMLLEEYSPEHSYVWHTLYRRSFLLDNHISFHPGIRFQDVPFTHECYLKARKCIKTNVLLNIYRMGQESSTSSFDTKRGKEFCIAISKTWELRHWEGHTPETLRKLQDDVFYSFSFLTSWISYSTKKCPNSAEILRFLKKTSPDMIFRNGVKQRVVSFLYRTTPQFYIKINIWARKLKRLLL